jgi:hypothetical protein
MSITVVDISSVRRVAGGSVSPRTLRSARSQEVPQLRLTRRGRWVVVVAVLALAFTALILLGAPAASTGQVRHVPAHTVVVQPGQTLWDIALAVAPKSDPRDEIAKIVDLNSLPDAGAIRAGQPLDIPAAH